MIPEHTKPVSTEVHDGPLSEEVTTHVVGFTPNGNPVIRTNHKLARMRHAFITLLEWNDDHHRINDGDVVWRKNTW
jgi:hypothetical protein